MAKPARIKKDIRISPEMLEWIENLPRRYGESFSEKSRYLLEVAREYYEKEAEAIRDAQQYQQSEDDEPKPNVG